MCKICLSYDFFYMNAFTNLKCCSCYNYTECLGRLYIILTRLEGVLVKSHLTKLFLQFQSDLYNLFLLLNLQFIRQRTLINF